MPGSRLKDRSVNGKSGRLAFTTRVKHRVNSVLRSVGLQLETTRTDALETARLKELNDRGHWSVPRYAHGLRLEPARYLEFLNTICSAQRPDFPDLPLDPHDGKEGFYLRNGWFQSVDAEVLYSLIRHFKPRRIVEIGSGFSTLLMRRAILDGGLNTKLTTIDPMPRVDVTSAADEQVQERVESIDLSRIVNALHLNDMLFIDSSHLIKTGGDVPYLCLEVFSKLPPGVLIHFHDIFLPFEYPKEWVVDFRWGWNEQYLVHGFLYNNFGYEIVWPAHYMWIQYRSEVLKIIACDPARSFPSSLWLKKVGNDVNP